MFDNSRQIVRVANALEYGATADDIHALLIGSGLTEEEAWLTFVAGRIIFHGRPISLDPSIPTTKRNP